MSTKTKYGISEEAVAAAEQSLREEAARILKKHRYHNPKPDRHATVDAMMEFSALAFASTLDGIERHLRERSDYMLNVLREIGMCKTDDEARCILNISARR